MMGVEEGVDLDGSDPKFCGLGDLLMEPWACEMRRDDCVVGRDPILDLEEGRGSMAGCPSQGGDGSAGSAFHRRAAGGNEWDRLFDFHGRGMVMVIDDFTGGSASGGEDWDEARRAPCCGDSGSLGAVIAVSPYRASRMGPTSGLSRRLDDERSREKLGAMIVCELPAKLRGPRSECNRECILNSRSPEYDMARISKTGCTWHRSSWVSQHQGTGNATDNM